MTLVELGDGGGALDPIAIAELATDTDDARANVNDGVARLQADATLDRVSFRGASAVVSRANGVVAEIVLEVLGRLASEGP